MANNFCSKCGAEIAKEEQFCAFCGKPRERKSEEEGLLKSIVDESQTTGALVYGELKERNYLTWFLISFFTLGIGGLVYLYFSIQDLEKLEVEIEEPMSRMRSSGNCLIGLICCLAVMAEFYNLYYSFQKHWKFDSILERISGNKRKHKLGGLLVLFSKIIRFLTIVVGIPVLAFNLDILLTTPWIIVSSSLLAIFVITSLIIIVQDCLWQKAYNELAKQNNVVLQK